MYPFILLDFLLLGVWGGCLVGWLVSWFGLVEIGFPLAAQVDLELLRVPLPRS